MTTRKTQHPLRLATLACMLSVPASAWAAPIVPFFPKSVSDFGPEHWAAIPLALLAAYFVGKTASYVLRRVAKLLVSRTEIEWDDKLVDRLGAPLTLALTTALIALEASLVALPKAIDTLVVRGVRLLFLASLFWALVRMVDIAAEVIRLRSLERPGSLALVKLGTRVGKVMVLALAVVALLSDLGYEVASLIAGLGLGGLAFALAAQKTVENLFGAFSIGADQPFREGDFVRVDDTVGTVELIGLRSTRIRTLDRTLVTIPNGRLADMRLESFAVRDRMRLYTVLGLVYDTKPAQMRAILKGLEQVLRDHPSIWPDTVNVRFQQFGASSLDVEIMAWFQTRSWDEFLVMRQDVLLAFMDVVEREGSGFAFPTRTIHLINERGS